MRKAPLPAPLLWHAWPILALCGIFAAIWPLEGALCALLIIFLDKRLRRPARLILALAFCVAGFCLAKSQIARDLPQAPPWTQSGPGKKTARFCARIESVRCMPDKRLQIVLSGVHASHAEGTSVLLPGKASWNWDLATASPLPGQSVCLTRPLIPLRGFANGSVSLYELARRSSGILWRVWSKENSGQPEFIGQANYFAKLRQDLELKLLGLISSSRTIGQEGYGQFKIDQASALLPALLFGNRFYLHVATTELFSRAAIAHSLALSGQHLAVAGLLGLLCVCLAARLKPNLYLWRPKMALAGLASIPAALIYLWIGNAPPSLLRSACMLLILCIFALRARSFSGQDIIFLALTVFLICDPLTFLEIGTQLSFLCVFVIALFLPGLEKFWPFYTDKDHRSNAYKRFFQIILISLIIQAALLPLTLRYFGQAGIWFPLNALWLPLLGIVMLPFAVFGLVLTALPSEITTRLAGHCLDFAVWPGDLLLKSLGFLERHGLLDEPVYLLPHGSAILAFALIIPALACLMSRKENAIAFGNKAIAIGILLLMAGPVLRLWDRLDNGLELDVFDVGQGQALCLSLPEQIIIDGGGSQSTRFDPGKALLAPALTANAPPKVLAIFNSHPDLDHLGGLIHLVRNFDYQSLWHNGRMVNSVRIKDVWQEAVVSPKAHIPARGDIIRLGNGDLYLEVLHPPANDPKWQGNNASLVLRLCRDGEGLALLPGDAENESLKDILASGADISAKVLIAPHHGSNSSYLPDFYKAVRPDLVVAACGFRNRYAYPGKKIRAWMQKNGITLLDTGNYGRISINFRSDGKVDYQTALSGKN